MQRILFVTLCCTLTAVLPVNVQRDEKRGPQLHVVDAHRGGSIHPSWFALQARGGSNRSEQGRSTPASHGVLEGWIGHVPPRHIDG